MADIAIARDCPTPVSSARVSTRRNRLNGKENPVAEQSSSTVMLRALVMLACLVAIPLAAIFGTSMPEIARKFLVANGPEQPSSSDGPDRHDSQFEPMSQANAASTLPASVDLPTTATDWQTRPTVPDYGPDRSANPPRSAVISASYETVGHASKPPGTTDWPQNAAPALLPAQQRAPSAFNQFTQIQQRLRQLGATYYLLETWGSDGQSYRFYCRLPIQGDRTNSRYFEVIDTDQLRAMDRVLRQVEAWRARGG